MKRSPVRRHPKRGEVWMADLDPPRGHEQARVRPVVVVSNDTFNRGESQLVTVLPITETNRQAPLHIELHPPEAGLRHPSFVQCEQIRTIALARIGRRIGSIRSESLYMIEDGLRIHLDL